MTEEIYSNLWENTIHPSIENLKNKIPSLQLEKYPLYLLKLFGRIKILSDNINYITSSIYTLSYLFFYIENYHYLYHRRQIENSYRD